MSTMDPDEARAVFSRLVRARAEEEPERVALVFEHGDLPPETMRLGDLATRGNALAAALRRMGLRLGERLGVMLRNDPAFVATMEAASQLGLVLVPIDPRARADRLRYFLTFADCRAVVIADELFADEEVARVVSEAGIKPVVAGTVEGRGRGVPVPSGLLLLDEVLAGGEVEDQGEAVDTMHRPWMLTYSSGTTGEPKAIEFAFDRMTFYRLVPGFFGYREDDVPYTGLSLIHGNALVVTLMPALNGAVDHSVFSPWFTKTRIWDICARFGCTTWSNLGGIATAVYSEPRRPRDRDHPVRLVVSAGMPPELWRPFEERFGVRLLEWYGTMEGGFAYNPPGVGPVGSFGRPPPQFLMEVVDEDDKPVAPGELGELVLRPAAAPAALRYHRNPEASAAKVRGGWLHTGDMCRRDGQGWFYYGFRKEEGGIRRLGEFLSPGATARALSEDPEILDAHVFGVPAASGAPGESDVVGAVVVRDPVGLDVTGLLDRLQQRMPARDLPDYLWVLDRLPKTATEKVQAIQLAKTFQPGLPDVHRVRTARPA